MQEFHRIHTFFKPLCGTGAYDLCDDTACLGDFAHSTDTIVSGVHFIGHESPYQLAQKLLGTSLSDLASVGATPLTYSLNLTLPKGIDDCWFESFSKGLQYMQDTYGIYLLGGDTTHFSSILGENAPMVLSATVFGTAPYDIHRNTAQVGDAVCISGKTGLGYVGLQLALGAVACLHTPSIPLEHYYTPIPHIAMGKHIAPYVHACCDVSDGLVADVGHIATASHVDIVLYMPHIPICETIAEYSHVLDIQHAVLSGGDDYVLAFTVPENAISHLESCYRIGTVVQKSCDPTVRVLDESGRDITPKYTGYVHT